MSDIFLEIAKRPAARSLVQRIGLPVPMPEPLERARSPWREDELSSVSVLAALRGPLSETVEPGLRAAGAEISADRGEGRVGAILVDASGLDKVAQLRAIYDALRPSVNLLGRSGRVLVIGRPASERETPEASAVRQSLEGLVRSLAKEIGRRGATANLLSVASQAEDRATGVARFLLSRRSAFLTGQPLGVTRIAGALTGAPAPIAGSLRGKVALVTGAARGIGAATATLLAAEGAKVIVLDRPEDLSEAQKVASELRGTALGVDIASKRAADEVVRAIGELGGVDVVVHNAGVTRDRTLGKMSEREWEQAIQINLAAVVSVTDALVKSGLRDGGRVIMLSSIAGIAGNMGQTNYAASKAGVAGYARALAPVLAPHGITVNAVAPGFIETRMTAAIPMMIREAGRRLSALGQGGDPDDVGHLITFLATPHAQGLTGQVVRICGGAFVGA